MYAIADFSRNYTYLLEGGDTFFKVNLGGYTFSESI